MIQKSLIFLWSFFLVFPCFSQGQGGSKPVQKEGHTSKPKQSPAVSSVQSSSGKKILPLLNAVLQKYLNSNIQLKVEKTFRVPVINKVSHEKGTLHLQKGGRFRYFMRSSTSSGQLMIFDGKHLWYQPDIKIKIVLQLSTHPQWLLFSGLFNPHKFFEVFKVEKFQSTKDGPIVHLKPKQSITNIRQIILKVNRYIQGVQVLWNDVNNWQEYKFSNPWIKQRFPKSLFIFDAEGFEVISKVPGK